MIYDKCRYSKHKSGIEAELEVAKHFKNENNKVIHRLRSPYGEIDLLVLDKAGNIIFFEIKSIPQSDWMFDRISQSQIQRLKRSYEWIYSRTKIFPQMEIVFVQNKLLNRFPILVGDL